MIALELMVALARVRPQGLIIGGLAVSPLLGVDGDLTLVHGRLTQTQQSPLAISLRFLGES